MLDSEVARLEEQSGTPAWEDKKYRLPSACAGYMRWLNDHEKGLTERGCLKDNKGYDGGWGVF